MLPIVSPATAVSKFGLAACAALALASGAAAADQAADIETAIRAASRNYLLALQAGDAQRIAACWTPEGTFVDAQGAARPATELIREAYAAQPTAEAEVAVPAELPEVSTTIRVLSPTSALELASAGPAGPAMDLLAVWVRRNDAWLLDYVREIAPAAPVDEALPRSSSSPGCSARGKGSATGPTPSSR